MKPSRLFALLLAVLAVAGLTACGDDGPQSKAESEGTYVTVDNLRYQVQISRQLNPTDVEDRDYLTGVRRADLVLAPDEVWFGVFVKVTNNAKGGPHLPTATGYYVTDTQENRYNPVAARNVLAYTPTTLGPKESYPRAVEPAAYSPTQGKLLLFKLKNDSLANRPLELTIVAPSGDTGSIELDV